MTDQLTFAKTPIITETAAYVKTHEGWNVSFEIKAPKTLTHFWAREGFLWMGYRKGPDAWGAFPRRALCAQKLIELRTEMTKPGKRYSRAFWASIEWLLAGVEVFLRGELDQETADSLSMALANLYAYTTKNGAYVFISDWQIVSSIADCVMLSNAGFSQD